MIYECDKCKAALPPGVRACPKCGPRFHSPGSDAWLDIGADDLHFDDTCFDRLMDTMKADAGALTWCVSCHVVSRFGDWAVRHGRRCRCPAVARMLWNNLRVINPALPPEPPLGQPYRVAV